MIRRTPPSLQDRAHKAGKRTTRTVRRAWVRHSDRLATDEDYRDALIDVAVIVLSPVVRHPLIRLLDASLLLRRASTSRRAQEDVRPAWGSGRGLE